MTLTGSSLDGICGIQLSFTENIHSPLFESKKAKPAQHCKIDINRSIKYIEGRVRDSRTNQLRLLDYNGSPIMDSQAYYEDGNSIRHEVPPNMAIIGVYGVKDKFNLTSFGFLLWDISAFQ